MIPFKDEVDLVMILHIVLFDGISFFVEKFGVSVRNFVLVHNKISDFNLELEVINIFKFINIINNKFFKNKFMFNFIKFIGFYRYCRYFISIRLF
jgi:hypothetical protein